MKFNDYAKKILLPVVCILIILVLISFFIGNHDLTIGLAVLVLITSVFGLVLGRE